MRQSDHAACHAVSSEPSCRVPTHKTRERIYTCTCTSPHRTACCNMRRARARHHYRTRTQAATHCWAAVSPWHSRGRHRPQHISAVTLTVYTRQHLSPDHASAGPHAARADLQHCACHCHCLSHSGDACPRSHAVHTSLTYPSRSAECSAHLEKALT